MAITRSFKDTVQSRAARDPEFRRALLAEAVNELIAGDFHVAKTILRDYINATITFPKLAEKLNNKGMGTLVQKVLFTKRGMWNS